MITYRFCSVDFAGARIPSQSVMCRNDKEAMLLARHLARRTVQCEVWFGNRPIGIACSIFAPDFGESRFPSC